MPRPLTDDERTRIVELLGEGLSHAAVAAQVGRAASTVGNIARSIGHRSGQTNLTRAHEARSAFCAERRAKAAALAQERLEELLIEVWDAPVETVVPGTGGTVTVAPSPQDRHRISQAASALMRTVLDVDRHDNRADERGTAEVDRWLLVMMGKDPEKESA